jgi:hypothetical protein
MWGPRVCCQIAHDDVVSRALGFSERASICLRRTSETSSRKTVHLHFYLRPCYPFALTSFSFSDWKLVVKLKGLLNIPKQPCPGFNKYAA